MALPHALASAATLLRFRWGLTQSGGLQESVAAFARRWAGEESAYGSAPRSCERGYPAAFQTGTDSVGVGFLQKYVAAFARRWAGEGSAYCSAPRSCERGYPAAIQTGTDSVGVRFLQKYVAAFARRWMGERSAHGSAPRSCERGYKWVGEESVKHIEVSPGSPPLGGKR
jgi:hypothetical protein